MKIIILQTHLDLEGTTKTTEKRIGSWSARKWRNRSEITSFWSGESTMGTYTALAWTAFEM